jgi:aspartate/methionine/tyrosine aminotransferase
MPRFSRRTDWPARPNRLSELLESRRREGIPLVDLTCSNPTEAGLPYPAADILRSLADPSALTYAPDPKGLESAREAVCAYYRAKDIPLSPADVILTASTSEAYAHAFTLLCEPGDEILIPAPSYPLFEYLAQLSGVTCRTYPLRYDQGWHIDTAALEKAVTGSTRAIVLIHPHNPTGMFLRRGPYAEIRRVARERDLALIVDEVFADYPFGDDTERVPSCASTDDVLTFTLSGLSKLACLPQMKLGWMVLSGPAPARAEAHERLETVCDTYLSVNTPVQLALADLLDLGKGLRKDVRARIVENDRVLRELCAGTAVTPLVCEGGWYGILRLPQTRSDEEWALEILRRTNVSLYPGYFFDIDGCSLVVSLLPEAALFADGIGRVVRFVEEATSPSPR